MTRPPILVASLAFCAMATAVLAQRPVVRNGRLATDSATSVRLADSARMLENERHARPGDVGVALRLAGVLEQSNERFAALALYDTLIRASSPAAEVFGADGRFWLVNGRADSASAVLERGVARYPADGRLWGLLGDARARAKAWRPAVVAYRKAAALLPGRDSISLSIIDASVAAADTADAIRTGRDLRLRVAGPGSTPSVLLGAASRMEPLGRPGEAAADSLYRFLLSRDPRQAAALEGRGRTALALGDTAAALDASRRALSDERSGAGPALLLLRAGHPEEDSARALLRVAARRALAAQARAEMAFAGAGNADAGRLPTELPDARGTDALLRTVLDTLVFRTTWGAAELDDLRRSYPGSDVLRVHAARVALDAGRPADALQLYDVALAHDATDVDAQLGRASALQALGRRADAALAAQRALELAPEREDAFRVSLRIAEQSAGMAGLLDEIRRLRQRMPKSAVLAEHETELRERIGRPPSAALAPHGAQEAR